MLGLPKLSFDPVLFLPLWLGTFRDHSGYGNHGTNSGGYWSQSGSLDGIRFRSTNRIDIADSPELRLLEGTLFFSGVFDGLNTNRRLAYNQAGGPGYDCYLSPTKISLYDGVGIPNAVINWEGAGSIALSFKNGEKFKGYTDGAFKAEANIVSDLSTSTGVLSIGGRGAAASSQLQGSLQTTVFYPGILPAPEIAELHDYSQSLITPRRQWPGSGLRYPSTINPNEPGLAAAYDMENIHGSIIDKVGSADGSVGGVAGSTPGPAGIPALKFSGVGGIAVARPVAVTEAGSYSISFLVNPASLGVAQGIYAYATGGLDRNVAHFDTGGRLRAGYYNGIYTGAATVSLPAGTWHHITVVNSAGAVTLYLNGVDTGDATAPNLSTVDDIIGNIATKPLIASLAEFRVYARALSATEALGLYLKHAGRPVYLDNIQSARVSVVNETSGKLSNTGYQIESGAWRVQEDATTGERYIQCMVAGRISRRNLEAYDTWQFALSKEYGGNSAIFGMALASRGAPADASQLGYWLNLSNAEVIRFVESTGGGIINNPYTGIVVDFPQRYDFTVTRSAGNEWHIYIKGGSFGSAWVLLPVTVGTNPFTNGNVTDSKYVVCDLKQEDILFLDRQFAGVLPPL